MHATPIALSPRWNLDRCERLVRSRLKRDGAVTVAVSPSDQRQLRHLKELGQMLAADQSLRVQDGLLESEHAGLLMVTHAGEQAIVWFRGEFKTA